MPSKLLFMESAREVESRISVPMEIVICREGISLWGGKGGMSGGGEERGGW